MSVHAIASTAPPIQPVAPAAPAQKNAPVTTQQVSKPAASPAATVQISNPAAASQPVKIAEPTPIKIAVSASSSQPSAVQEATETPDVTRKEAAKGDRQAIKLLAQQAAAQTQSGKKGIDTKS